MAFAKQMTDEGKLLYAQFYAKIQSKAAVEKTYRSTNYFAPANAVNA